MGSFISRFWKRKVTTLEELVKIEENLKKIEEYRKSTEQKQKKTVANIVIYGAALYILACVIVFVWYLPESWIVRLGLLIPLTLIPVILYGMKRLISGYFNSKMISANKQYENLQQKKLKIINNVMETETFNKAKEILSKFAPEKLGKKEIPLAPAFQSKASLVAKTSQIPQLRKRSVDNPPQVTASTLGPLAPRAVRGEPQPLFSRDRSITDKLVEYIVGDGPGYRFALICKHCYGHNGMAIQEEFPYVAFNCCFCLKLNPARNQRPLAPPLSDSTVSDSTVSDSTVSDSTATLDPLPVIQENVGDDLRVIGSDIEEKMEVIQENVGDDLRVIGSNIEEEMEVIQENVGDDLRVIGSDIEEKMEDSSDSEASSLELHPSPIPVAEVDRRMLKRKSGDSATTRIKKKQPRPRKKDELEVYEVEEVVSHSKKGKSHFYLVKWENWSSECNTWEPVENMSGCHEALFSFLEKSSSENPCVEHVYLDLKNQLSVYDSSELDNLLEEYITPKGISIPVPDDERTEKRLRIISKLSESVRDPKVVEIVRRELLEKKLYSKRQSQLDDLKKWECEMNSIIGKQTSFISVINNVDLEGPPENFIYINDYLPGKMVNIPEDPPYGCSCKPQCSSFKKKCCPSMTGSSFAYDKFGRVKVPHGTPIYECNKRCKCGPKCVNRVVQKGRSIKLSIFRTSSGCGWGVKTLENIPKGTFVSENVGEVITFEEAEKRGKKYDAVGQTYLFDLDFNDTNVYPFTVDAALYGNVSHFVNHSCDPNMTVYAVWVDCLDPNLPKLALFANRDIKQGEEISFDYLNQSKTKTTSKGDINRNGFVHSVPETTSQMVCKCGSKKCRKYYL